MKKIECKICSLESQKIFSTNKILNKYNADYFKCNNCGFIFISDCFWLKEAYSSPIHNIDTGIIKRNYKFSSILSKLLKKEYNDALKYLDYGAGYGIFVRMMRDKGYNFYWYDKYSKNLFAKDFSFNPQNKNKFELLSLIEVLEHSPNPLDFFSDLFEHSNDIFFTTEIIRNNNIQSIDDWHYFAPMAGQHISFFSIKSLQIIAKKFNKNIYSDGKQIHLITNKKLNNNIFKKSTINRFIVNKLRYCIDWFEK